MCDEWKHSFEAFYRAVGDPPPSTSIDRIDNDGNYEPGNVRWATAAEQAMNTRRSHKFVVVFRHRIQPMKPGDQFKVYSKADRSAAVREGRAMKRYGVIQFGITSYEHDDGTFSIIAV